MTAYNAYLGEVVHYLKSGHVRCFKPAGEVYSATARGRIAKASELASDHVESLPVGGYAARIFVGLNVGVKTKYTLEDVMRFALSVRKKQGKRADGSFLAQKGIYEDMQGRTIEEPSVQIVLIDLAGTEPDVWTKEMIELATSLRNKFKQETVILEIQKRGIVESLYSVTA